MLKVNSDFYNAVFNKPTNFKDVTSITLDVDHLQMIDPEIVTTEDIWSIMVMLSLITKSKEGTRFYKSDIISTPTTTFDGKEILKEIKSLAMKPVSGGTAMSTLEAIGRAMDAESKYPVSE